MGEPICERWVSEAAPGKSFAEVGGLWGTVNEQVTIAARAGATATTMIDVAPSDGGPDDLWMLFRERARSLGVEGTTCLQGSIDDPETPRRAGSFDVVCCNGVLYHCPDPLHTLRQLRAITRETLILGTVSMPETVSSSAGVVSVEPGSALFVPATNQSQRAVLGQWLRELGDIHIQAVGITHEVQSGWALDDYDPWWWFFTRDYVAGLLRVAGFEVESVASYWEGRATLYLARAVGSPPQSAT
jgi:SAM-dependent methyltransferase